MKNLFKQTKQNALYLATVACLMLAGSMSAFAISPSQVASTAAVQTITAACSLGFSAPSPGNCPLFNPFVEVTEPATVKPVIVTWSADYNTSGTSVVGLSVNGGVCNAYGPFTLEEPQLIAGSNSITLATTHQWVVLPSDGLVTGKNLFFLCAGGYEKVQTINIGFSTLTVQTQ
jgi:hypothetical protein